MTGEPLGARRSGHVRALRLVLVALVVLVLAPGTFVRAPAQLRADQAEVTITPRAEREGISGALPLDGVWELTSPHGWFGGFSALVRGEGASLIAGSDRGFLLDLDVSGAAPRAVRGSFRFVGISNPGRKEVVDLESLARDPATGTLWAAFERDNLVMRLSPDTRRRTLAPPAMGKWSANSGPETMERLDDGRFLLIAEDYVGNDRARHEALLFPGDPVDGVAPLAFHFIGPPYFEPVDAAQLPDGRALILLRVVNFSVPPRFNTTVAIADPRDIRAGGEWGVRQIAYLQKSIFAENFEGIAYVPSAADPQKGSVWLIADDNFSMFQRTLLVRLRWDGTAFPNEKAPGNPDA